MKPRFASIVLGCVLTGLLGSGLEAAPSKPQSDASAKADAKGEKPAKPTVHKGMTAEEVVNLIGKPTQVKEIAVGDAKGESWIYRRVAKRTMNQTAATVESIPTYGGLGMTGDAIVNVDAPSQRMESITIYQMTALLMFDGKLVASKQWLEQERRFE